MRENVLTLSFMFRDVNILTIENLIPLDVKNIPKVYIYTNRNNQII